MEKSDTFLHTYYRVMRGKTVLNGRQINLTLRYKKLCESSFDTFLSPTKIINSDKMQCLGVLGLL